jgi:hypothetical protein
VAAVLRRRCFLIPPLDWLLGMEVVLRRRCFAIGKNWLCWVSYFLRTRAEPGVCKPMVLMREMSWKSASRAGHIRIAHVCGRYAAKKFPERTTVCRFSQKSRGGSILDPALQKEDCRVTKWVAPTRTIFRPTQNRSVDRPTTPAQLRLNGLPAHISAFTSLPVIHFDFVSHLVSHQCLNKKVKVI